MDENDWLADRFEQHRAHLRAVAYRMLGSLTDADDAVQEAWMRLSRADTSDVKNVRGWRSTGMSPIRSSAAARAADPEHEALLAARRAARLCPARHVRRARRRDRAHRGASATAARQLASRARRRVQEGATAPDADLSRQRQVVDAFFAAARGGDLQALVAVLDPDVVLRSDRGGAPGMSVLIRGAQAVAAQALMFAAPSRLVRPALVNGAAGVVVTADGRLVAVMGFTVADGRIVAIDALGDPERLSRLDLTSLDD